MSIAQVAAAASPPLNSELIRKARLLFDKMDEKHSGELTREVCQPSKAKKDSRRRGKKMKRGGGRKEGRRTRMVEPEEEDMEGEGRGKGKRRTNTRRSGGMSRKSAHI